MYIIRNIFYLKFGHYKDAKALLDDANKKGLLPEAQDTCILTDFTGDAYRLILEEGYNTLADFEQHFQNSMAEQE
jgi:hypothetical protein